MQSLLSFVPLQPTWLPAMRCILQVAQIAFPVFLARCQTMLAAFSRRIAAGTEADDRLHLEETLCLLEVCTTMTVSPAVVDVACAEGGSMQVPALVCQLLSPVCLFVPFPLILGMGHCQACISSSSIVSQSLGALLPHCEGVCHMCSAFLQQQR